MLHPSYSDLMKVVNSEVEPGKRLWSTADILL